MLSHDSRLRCDIVDFYFILYGMKKPLCIPIPELAGLMAPRQEPRGSSSLVSRLYLLFI